MATAVAPPAPSGALASVRHDRVAPEHAEHAVGRPPDAPVAGLERASEAGGAENETFHERLDRAVSRPAPP
eukprot:11113050-Lingulodinium_polyedra.AAC.1